jgi:P pilus assembly chaperone PapD
MLALIALIIALWVYLSTMPGPKYFTAVFVTLLLSSSAVADLILTPDTIEFRNDSVSKSIVVTNDGKPVLPGEIISEWSDTTEVFLEK